MEVTDLISGSVIVENESRENDIYSNSTKLWQESRVYKL